MDVIESWLEQAHDHIEDDRDLITLVIGDEGVGKSTLLLQCGWIWLKARGEEPTPEKVMEQIAWDLGHFKEKLAYDDQGSLIMVHDAARVLSRKKAMHGDQIEMEEDLFDARVGRHHMLLGYQEFDIVPTVLAQRRAKQCIRVVKRGWVHGYGEDGIRKREDTGEWPDPVIRDSFPDLEGTDLWDAFRDEDLRRKQERIAPDDDEEDEELTVEELAEQIRQDGLEPVVSIHGGHNRPYIDKDLIEIEYGTSGNKAKKVAKLLKKQVNVEQTVA